jgi:hypothetical protein
VDEGGVIPYWMAFVLGPVLLVFALWVLPGRNQKAHRRILVARLSSASLKDALDGWFPTMWAGGVGIFGAIFAVGGLLRLIGIE